MGCYPVVSCAAVLDIHSVVAKKRLPLKFFAAFAPVITFYDSVVFVRFLDLVRHLYGFLFRPEGFPVERRVGCPANMVMNTQVYGFCFVLSNASVSDQIIGKAGLRNHEVERIPNLARNAH